MKIVLTILATVNVTLGCLAAVAAKDYARAAYYWATASFLLLCIVRIELKEVRHD